VNTFDEEGCSRKGTLNGPPELDQKTQQENDQENEHH
jgi:predicted small lipoprotein YifL